MSKMYIVQPFKAGKRGALYTESPIQAQSTSHARRMAERLSESRAAVVAFQREGNTVTGEYGDPELIAAFGRFPPEVMEMRRVD